MIYGANGSGKSSLLEALHYACYLRSFRTHLSRDIIHFKQPAFSLDVVVTDDDGDDHTVHVGCSGDKKIIKVDERAITTYRQLTDYYRVITTTEDDLMLIKGSPEERRTFLDQALALLNPDYLQLLRNYRKIVSQRNALLQTIKNSEQYDLWTEQLWLAATPIWQQRDHFIKTLEQEVNTLIHAYIDRDLSVTLRYTVKKRDDATTCEQFLQAHPELADQERAMGRSLFGPHLDDMYIGFHGKASRAYASRGQQKLIIVLIKFALAHCVRQVKGDVVLLMDDFITDFDAARLGQLLALFKNSSYQIIVTTPVDQIPGFTNLSTEGIMAISIDREK